MSRLNLSPIPVSSITGHRWLTCGFFRGSFTWPWRWAGRPTPIAEPPAEAVMNDLRRAGRAATDMAVGHLSAVADGPVWRPVSESDRSWLTEQPLPATGRDVADLLDDVRDRMLPYP